MKRSEQITDLATALAKAQGSMGELQRTLTATIPTKKGGQYSYSYAPLDACYHACRKPLADNGLSIVQSFTADPLEITTTLLHESGQWLESTLPLTPNEDTAQALGSVITYMRRYTLMPLVGLAAETDDDGAAASQLQQQSQSSTGGVRHPTANQIKRLYAIAHFRGWADDAIHAYALKEWEVEHLDQLSLEQYKLLCGEKEEKITGILEDAPPKQESSDQLRYDLKARSIIGAATDWQAFQEAVTKILQGYLDKQLDNSAVLDEAADKMLNLAGNAMIDGGDLAALGKLVEEWAHFSADQRKQLRVTHGGILAVKEEELG
jgi:hypothetical protein